MKAELINSNLKALIKPKTLTEIQTTAWENLKEGLECGGLLSFKFNPKTDTITIQKQKILKQEVTQTEIEISKEDVAIFISSEEGKKTNWNGWWHSHHTMGTGWSKTDDEQTEEISGNAKQTVALLISENDIKIKMITQIGTTRIEIDEIPLIVAENEKQYNQAKAKAQKQTQENIEEKKIVKYKKTKKTKGEKEELYGWEYPNRDAYEQYQEYWTQQGVIGR